VGLARGINVGGVNLGVPPGTLVTFQFGNVDLDLPFDNILILVGDTRSTYMCLAIMSSTGLLIFGNTQQQYYLVFAEVDNLQIGEARRLRKSVG
jgi:hypothetical protein